MKRTLPLALALLAGLAHGAAPATPATPSAAEAASPALRSGLETQYIDPSVRPQDDFFRHTQGKWLKEVEIPADKSDWGSMYIAREDVLHDLRAIIEQAAQDGGKAPGTDAQRIGDFYASFMDEAKLEQLGLTPLKAELARITTLRNKKGLPALFAHFDRIGVGAPIHYTVYPDARDSTRYLASIYQGSLGMPDADYYLKDDAKLAEARAKYLLHIEKMLALAGHANAAAEAKQVLELETALAKVQWTRVQNRDPIKTNNRMATTQLGALSPAVSLQAFLKAIGHPAKEGFVNVAQPSYVTGLGQVLESMPLETWKLYLEWRLLSGFANMLPKAFAGERFAFTGTVLGGAKEMRPRWQRGVYSVEEAMGFSVGKLYVARHFPPQHKARMEDMVKNFLAAFKDTIDGLDWMSPATKKEAHIKLSKIRYKIGYPEKWRDYSSLKINRNDLVGNVLRAREVNFRHTQSKLGQPIDRSEWGMTPQTVNAYYSPRMNEIVFPAARLRPPLFDANADDAANYGAVGISVGHEISHAFDDSGSQSDGDGNLRNWWTPEDREKFTAKAKMLVEQYNGYSPVPGHYLNGALTLGENIADTAGVVMALRAYRLSLGGKPAPVIDGMTGEQRLYFGVAQTRRFKARPERSIALIKSDPHSPGEFRVNGSLRNSDGFYQTFGVKEGDGMWLPPERRVSIW